MILTSLIASMSLAATAAPATMTADESAAAQAAYREFASRYTPDGASCAPLTTYNSTGVALRQISRMDDLADFVGRAKLPALRVRTFGEPGDRAKMSPAERNAVDAAFTATLSDTADAGSKLVPPEVAPGLPRAGQAQSCKSTMSLSTPEIRGDVAFVAIGYNCGSLCGAGATFALIREQAGWRPLVAGMHWVS